MTVIFWWWGGGGEGGSDFFVFGRQRGVRHLVYTGLFRAPHEKGKALGTWLRLPKPNSCN